MWAFPDVSCRRFASADEDGPAEFHVELSGDGGISSLFDAEEWPFRDDVKVEQSIRVTAKTLDVWFREEGLERVNFMWLDLEGVELPVLHHGQEVLQTVSAVFTEVNFVSARKGYTMYPDLDAFLARQGFAEAWRGSQGGVLWESWTGNVLYARRPEGPRSVRAGLRTRLLAGEWSRG